VNQARLAQRKGIVSKEVPRGWINLLRHEEEVGGERENLIEESEPLLLASEAEQPSWSQNLQGRNAVLFRSEILDANGPAVPVAGQRAHLTLSRTCRAMERVEHTDTRLGGCGARGEPVDEPTRLAVPADGQGRRQAETGITRHEKC
jgi:transposase-like protein